MDSFFECSNCGYRIVNFTEDDYLDDFGSLCYCQVEAHQEKDSTTEKEEEEMTPEHEKTAAEAATSTTGNQSIPKTSLIAYMHRTGHDNGHSYGSWSGEKLPFEDHTTLVVHWDSFVSAAVNGSATFHINRDCIDKYNAHVYELRAQEEAEAKRKAERDSAEREERLTIEAITGMDLYPGDLPFMILEYRREGKDFTKLLDAMQAVDDLELSRAGRTSWDYDPEMDDPA